VIVTQHPAARRKDLLVDLAGHLMSAQSAQIEGEIVRRGEGVGMFFAEDPTPALKRLLVELSGRVVLS
jgi:hypothetical protein